MSIEIPSLSDISEQWVAGAGAGAQRYATAVASSSVDWEGPTRAAEQAYATGVQAAITAKRFGKGVQNAGNDKWRRNSVQLGAQRFPGGVANAVEAYEQGFEPHRSTIAGLTLPPRGPRGSSQNTARVTAIGVALHNRRIELLRG